jgi:exopolyphosphatase/pppGpp-phosphohydrolase
MQAEAAAVRAVIDIGSNTTHVVVARCSTDTLDILVDEVELIRTGESVTKTGALSSEVRDAVLHAIQKYQQLAAQYEAEVVIVVATEALRQARNSEELFTAIQRATGLEVQLIAGTAEAALTFYGATYGRDIPADVGVLDAGGGSTEIVLAQHKRITWLTSVPIGSGHLRDAYFASDPPARQEMDNAREHVRNVLRDAHMPKAVPAALIATGSSAPALLQVAQQAFQFAEHTDRLTRDDLLRCEGLLYGLPAETIAQQYHLPPERARVLPGGLLIIQECMVQVECSEVRVSVHGLREGILLAYARYGAAWLDQPEMRGELAQQIQEQTPSFMQFGHDELRKSIQKFAHWRDIVLKREDVEAVHKMRVASRRLRALMDAYTAINTRKIYKKAYQRVKQVAAALGGVRDTDVMLQRMQERSAHAASDEQAGIHWFIERLQVYHDARQQAMDVQLRDLDVQDLQQQIIGHSMDREGKAHG